MRTDPVAEMFCTLKNAYLRKKVSCNVLSSNLKLELAKVLKKIGLISGFRENGNAFGKRFLHINLAYDPSDGGGFFKKKSKFGG
jgi:ribosomal protein S8